MNEDKLINASMLIRCAEKVKKGTSDAESLRALNFLIEELELAPAVDAVEVPDEQLLRAVKLLLKQYEHSKKSAYVRNPVAHALFHTWKYFDK